MILSLHVPKAAGNSFRQLLQAGFGERLMLDYGDWAGFKVPEALERCRVRTAATRSRRDELVEKYDIIHGHFVTDKYLGLFPKQEIVAFFRDPYQQAVSHYCFLLRNPQREHLEEKMLHEAKMTLHDYLAWDAFRDQQSQYLGSVSIDDLAMVGLSEEFYKSVHLFNSVVGCDLQGDSFLNVNPDHQGADYKIDQDVRIAVEYYRAADIDLYGRAKVIFSRESAK
ncbi:MAG: hypothetical protein ACREBW_07210, partial [Candidatus Micrarchaeaceae archaeon]